MKLPILLFFNNLLAHVFAATCLQQRAWLQQRLFFRQQNNKNITRIMQLYAVPYQNNSCHKRYLAIIKKSITTSCFEVIQY